MLNKPIFLCSMVGCLLFSWSCKKTARQYNNAFRQSGFPVAENIQPIVQGFRVERILEGQGDWLSITLDPQGRFLISPRKGLLTRVAVSDFAAGTVMVDTLDCGVTDAQSLLYADKSLYMMGTGPDGRGVYRLLDSTGNGHYSQPRLLKQFTKNGDHSGHTILKGDDGWMYFLSGNENKVDFKDSSVQFITKNWEQDELAPMESGWGHNYVPPGGFVMRFKPDGSSWQFYCGGQRNPYDMAFSAQGEIFNFDSDMEWDYKLPWYRPTRVNHLVSGGDYGWRQGTGKRFDNYPDIWPSVLDLERGSPTSVSFGTGAAYPAKYQKALFLGDWSFGRIWAMEVLPDGASYKGKHELFIQGKPLNITDMALGPDSCLYFVTGGNGTGSGLYRIAYTGTENTEIVEPEPLTKEAQLRKWLESKHFTEPIPADLDTAWQYMDHADRFVRHAARVLLEKFPPDNWKSKALAEKEPKAREMALLSLIRTNDSTLFEPVWQFLAKDAFDGMTKEEQLSRLRLLSLAFLRLRAPSAPEAQDLYSKLLNAYPADDLDRDREYGRMFSYLGSYPIDAAAFIEKTIQAMEKTKDPVLFTTYLWALRTVKNGWTPATLSAYAYWVGYGKKALKGGSLFAFALDQMQQDWEKSLGAGDDRGLVALEPKPLDASAQGPIPYTPIPAMITEGGNRPFIKNYTFEDFGFALELVNSPRNKNLRDFENGRKMFEVGQCRSCHYLNGAGGSFGPELDAAANAFSVKDLLNAILLPSEAITSRYQATEFELKDGSFVRGRIQNESDDVFVVQLDQYPEHTAEVSKKAIKKQSPSNISEMPPGLVNTMEEEDIMDLLYFITKSGKMESQALSLRLLPDKPSAAKGDTIWVEMVTYTPGSKIMYTLDGKDPAKAGIAYQGPVPVTQSLILKAVNQKADSTSAMVQKSIHFVDTVQNGISFKYYEGGWQSLPDFDQQSPVRSGRTYRISLDEVIKKSNNFGLSFTGKINIPVSGTYTFYLQSDDGAKLWINNKELIWNNQRYRLLEGKAALALAKGQHDIRVDYIEEIDYQFLELWVEGPGLVKQEVPASWLVIK